jgi:uncharacterized protein YodC (DUF2158 family)
MTVEQVGEAAMTGVETVWCTWFEKVGNRQEVKRDGFVPAVLRTYQSPNAILATRRS